MGPPSMGEVISSLGLMTSSSPGPPPASLNCSMMLWISDREPPSCSSSLAYRFSSSDLKGEWSSSDWTDLACEGVREGGWEVLGVAGVGST